MECIDNLVGITQSDCLCMTEGLSPEQIAAARLSVSGLYLDGNLEGGVLISDIKNFATCEEYFNLATKAIAAAKTKFEGDLRIVLNEKYTKRLPRFKGTLGRLTFSAALPVAKPYQVLKIQPISTTDSLLKVRGLSLIVNETAELQILLIKAYGNNLQGDIIQQYTATPTANLISPVNIGEGLELPLIENGEIVTYYFVWVRPNETIMPRDNKNGCGCISGDAFSNYVAISGGETDNLTTLSASDGYAHGFVIEAEIGCDVGQIICSDFDAENPIAITSAWANLYKAGEILIEKVLQSSEINRLTLMNREYLWGKRNHFRKEYDNRLIYLREAIDLSGNNCFICRDRQMVVGNIYG